MLTFENLLTQLNDYLHEHLLDSNRFENLKEKTLESILWNDERTEIIAVDQNFLLTRCRDLVRQCLQQLIDFAWENPSINDKCFHFVEQMKIYHKIRSKNWINSENFIEIDRDEYVRLRFVVLQIRSLLLRLLIVSPSCLTG